MHGLISAEGEQIDFRRRPVHLPAGGAVHSIPQRVHQVNDDYWIWGAEATQPRLLHTMVRVADLDRSLRFYCDELGMRLLSRVDVAAGRFSIAFIGFGEDYSAGALELTYNWDHPANREGYSHGSGYGHVAIGIPDLHGFCERLAARGIPLASGPKSLLPGAPALAFIKDPDGYAIELIQTSKQFSRPA